MHGDRRPWQLHQHAHRAPNRSQTRGRQSEARPHGGGHRRRKTSSTQASRRGRRRGRSTPPRGCPPPWPWPQARSTAPPGRQPPASPLAQMRSTPPWAQHATPRPSLP
ncbi:hypothetical protein PAHAL_4G281600 [Panicum hallii]|uniref:Uncharacterized protein n=1 Tax=Panicum hallii TaxID=206008 RepID=A0A2T8JE65_9POAL|nr:hypothetical protein PAHAL_4G281600 [Panicum hallii]